MLGGLEPGESRLGCEGDTVTDNLITQELSLATGGEQTFFAESVQRTPCPIAQHSPERRLTGSGQLQPPAVAGRALVGKGPSCVPKEKPHRLAGQQ